MVGGGWGRREHREGWLFREVRLWRRKARRIEGGSQETLAIQLSHSARISTSLFTCHERERCQCSGEHPSFFTAAASPRENLLVVHLVGEGRTVKMFTT